MPVSPVPALSQDSHIFVPAMLMAALGRGKGEVIPISWRPREIKQFLTKNWGLKPGQLQSPVLSTVHQTPCTFAQVWYAALSSTEEGTHTDCTQLHATWRTVVFFIFFFYLFGGIKSQLQHIFTAALSIFYCSTWASLQLWHTGSVVAARRLSYPAARGIPVPRQGSNPHPLRQKADSFLDLCIYFCFFFNLFILIGG